MEWEREGNLCCVFLLFLSLELKRLMWWFHVNVSSDLNQELFFTWVGTYIGQLAESRKYFQIFLAIMVSFHICNPICILYVPTHVLLSGPIVFWIFLLFVKILSFIVFINHMWMSSYICIWLNSFSYHNCNSNQLNLTKRRKKRKLQNISKTISVYFMTKWR